MNADHKVLFGGAREGTLPRCQRRLLPTSLPSRPAQAKFAPLPIPSQSAWQQIPAASGRREQKQQNLNLFQPRSPKPLWPFPAEPQPAAPCWALAHRLSSGCGPNQSSSCCQSEQNTRGPRRAALPAQRCPCPASPGHPGPWPFLPDRRSALGSHSRSSCWGRLREGRTDTFYPN